MRPDLQVLLTYWQQALRLQDWRVSAEYVSNLSNESGDSLWGLCVPITDSRTARLSIRDPATPPPGSSLDEAVKQVEETVVHELCHLWMAPFGARSPAEISHEENAVWAISEALIKVKGTPAQEQIARAMIAKLKVNHFASRRRVGETSMDPEMVKTALDALVSGDAEKCAEILKEMIAAAAGGGAALSPDPEPAPMNAAEAPPPPAAGEGETMDEEKKPEALAVARKSRVAEIDLEYSRARKASESMIKDAIRSRVYATRIVEGIELPPSVEKKILAQTSLERAEELLETAREMLAQGGAHKKSRAASPENTGDVEDLTDLSPRDRVAYQTMKESGRDQQASQYLKSALRIARARSASK